MSNTIANFTIKHIAEQEDRLKKWMEEAMAANDDFIAICKEVADLQSTTNYGC